ncbi:type II toxin-antitoxin system HicA family toxin [bacterium]|nr:type II toxin-antitoxin system HicA family toxin [bacterium]
MPPLPSASGMEVLAAFERLGWIYRRRESSHMILTRPGVFGALAIPNKPAVARGTLRALLRVVGVSVEEFTAALRSKS